MKNYIDEVKEEFDAVNCAPIKEVSDVPAKKIAKKKVAKKKVVKKKIA